MTAALCFLDTETDGVHPHRRAWEVAMIRRDDDRQSERHFFVALDMRNSDPFALNIGRFWDRHPAGRKTSGKPSLPAQPLLNKHDAAKEVMRWTFGAHIVGAVPNFDTETLAGLLRSEGYLPAWHYHLVDVEAMAVGWLNGRAKGHANPVGLDGRTVTLVPPWSSDDLSRACGIDPPSDNDRHTALGDARWAMRWYDALTGGVA